MSTSSRATDPAGLAAPEWDTDGLDWPNRACSRFVATRTVRWHVQRAGTGPVLLLLHGTGAATFTWRHLLPSLAASFTVIAPDLPGHGFSRLRDPDALSCEGMASALGDLCDALGVAPALGVGHSAGAAVLIRMALDRRLDPAVLLGLAPALVPPPPGYRFIAGPLGALVRSPLTARLAARAGREPAVLRSLLAPTGSALDRIERAWYARLFTWPAHIAAGLGMMSRWSLPRLVADAPALRQPLVLAAARRDGFVPFDPLRRVAGTIPAATFLPLEGVGHLFHEEAPDDALALILRVARGHGVPA
ncbi:MAG: alpha/beta fold hydrolase [Gemmatimonadales bacterium]|nr:alpha/beta fold hydrolase [Gemmatimonadales bacterium]